MSLTESTNCDLFGIPISNIESQYKTELEEKSSVLKQENESKIQEEIDKQLSEEEVNIRYNSMFTELQICMIVIIIKLLAWIWWRGYCCCMYIIMFHSSCRMWRKFCNEHKCSKYKLHYVHILHILILY